MNEFVHTQPRPDFYKAGGPLDTTVPSYIVRAADTELLETVKHGQFCYILTPRQMGKSSLMARTAQHLQENGAASVIIDLSAGDVKNASLETWYQGQISEISQQLGITEDYDSWWKEHNHLGVVQRFTQFLRQIVLKQIPGPIVIFIDEIDSTISLPFDSDDYFAAIRALYNRRAFDPELKRLTFVLLGVASPSDLIKDPTRTPFNIGTRIQLTDFTPEEVQQLISGLAPDPDIARQLLDQIYRLTGGHPFLTQKTCMRVAKWAKEQWNLNEAAIVVDEVVEEMFLSEAGRNTDDHLKYILKRILASESAIRLLECYLRILTNVVRDNELDPIVVELKLSGLIKANEGGVLIVRNAIYKRVFDKKWIKIALAEQEVRLDKGSADVESTYSVSISEQEPQHASKFLYDVYVSYSSRDREWVQDYLVPRLQEAGLKIWIDWLGLRPGDVWRNSIESALEESRNMLFVLSPSSVSSQVALDETENFLSLASKEQGRLFIPLLFKPTEVPFIIRSFTWIDFTQEDTWETSMDQLLTALGAPMRTSEIQTRGKPPVLSTSQPPKQYHTAAIRSLLYSAFEDEELMAFVYDYFRPLYKQITPSMSTNQKIQMLIEYADKNGLLDELLDAIARQKPRHYNRFRDQLE